MPLVYQRWAVSARTTFLATAQFSYLEFYNPFVPYDTLGASPFSQRS